MVVLLALAVTGCDWEKIADGADKTNAVIKQGEQVAVATSFLTGPYGELAVPALGALSAIATAFAAFARKKVKKVAKAASEAAELTDGGGAALVKTSLENGVIEEIKKIYDKPAKPAKIGG